MTFTLFWMAYERWRINQQNPELGDLVLKLLAALEEEPRAAWVN